MNDVEVGEEDEERLSESDEDGQGDDDVSMDEEEGEDSGLATMDRFKDDLFADDDEDRQQEGAWTQSYPHCVYNLIL